ncbi:MAG: LysM peptidoglycan-binding domain-containing protein [Leeuwenhoekiella sp.]
MELGQLTKLKITAFKDITFRRPALFGFFSSPMNPDSYKLDYKVSYQEAQASGTSAASPKFDKILPQDLNLDILLDRSGVLPGYPSIPGVGILPDIEHFKRVVLDYDGETHKPHYLLIIWGTLIFKCVLVEMTINHQLFNSLGAPIRATISAKFKQTLDEDLRIAKENNNSPDLTHIRTVHEGDTLPLMTHRIYGDPKYYLEVARVNGIRNFRKLTPGQEIFFPPLSEA